MDCNLSFKPMIRILEQPQVLIFLWWTEKLYIWILRIANQMGLLFIYGQNHMFLGQSLNWPGILADQRRIQIGFFQSF